MFESLKQAYQTTFGIPLPLSDANIEEQLIGHPELGMQYATLATDGEKAAFLAEHAVDINTYLHSVVNGGEEPTAPTGDSPAKSARPAIEPETYNGLSDTKKAMVDKIIAENADLKRLRSAQSTINAVLIAREVPTDWMAGVPLCPVKEKTPAEANLKKTYQGSILTWLAAAKDKEVVVPTNAQLQELAAQHRARWEEKNPGKEKNYKAPDWATADNDADVLALNQALEGKGPMEVLVAGVAEDARTHAKAWRWNTKGYEVTYPTGIDGQGGTTTKAMSVNGLKNFLLNDADGAILGSKDDKTVMSAKLVMTRPKASKTNPGVTKPVTQVRVRNNNPSNPSIVKKAITAPVAGSKKPMTVKSAMSYLVVRAVRPVGADESTATEFRVSRVRLSLIWAEAPVFNVLPEYEALPGLAIGRGQSNKKQLSSKERKSVGDAVRNLYASILSGDLSDEELSSQGLSSIAATLKERAAQIASTEAEAFA